MGLIILVPDHCLSFYCSYLGVYITFSYPNMESRKFNTPHNLSVYFTLSIQT